MGYNSDGGQRGKPEKFQGPSEGRTTRGGPSQPNKTHKQGMLNIDGQRISWYISSICGGIRPNEKWPRQPGLDATARQPFRSGSEDQDKQQGRSRYLWYSGEGVSCIPAGYPCKGSCPGIWRIHTRPWQAFNEPRTLVPLSKKVALNGNRWGRFCAGRDN